MTAAENGDTAMRLLEEGLQIDILMTDVVMPGSLTGPQLAKRARDLYPGLPVLFVSGYPTEAIIHAGGIGPADHVLMKPASREALSKALRRALGKRP